MENRLFKYKTLNKKLNFTNKKLKKDYTISQLKVN